MSRPIDADALLEELWHIRWNLQMMDDTQTADKMMAGLRKAEEKIEAAPTIDLMKWVPASERLPEPDNVYKDDPTYYLVQNEYGDMMVAKFIKFPGGARVWQQIHQYGAIMEDIVAWMPRPKPWKGGKYEVN